MMLPEIDAFTSSTCPCPSATTAMISSAALPKVAFRKPPSAGPERSASSSVPRPMTPASGISDTAVARKTHGDVGATAASTHETGAKTMSRFSRLAASARAQPVSGSRSVCEAFDVLVVCARQEIEERVEAAVERAAQLWNGAVEGVQRHAGLAPVGRA